MPAILILTAMDRPCRRCQGQRAEPQDWLCQGCRTSLERQWEQLTQEIRLPRQLTMQHPRDFLG